MSHPPKVIFQLVTHPRPELKYYTPEPTFFFQPTPAFLPRESHGQRSLAGYSPWSCKELDTTEQLTLVMKQSESEGHSVVSDTLRSHGLYSPWNSPGQNTGMGSLSLLQGIFATQGSNPGLTHSLQVDSLPAEPQGKPKNTGVGSLSLLQGIFLTQDQTRVSCIAEGFLTK